MTRFRVCVIVPRGYVHAECFVETALLFRHTLLSMGYDCDLTLNELSKSRINIILGVNLLGPDASFEGYNVILFQLEQLSETEGWFTPQKGEMLARSDAVWDYSLENVSFLKERGIAATYVPLGFHSDLQTIYDDQNKDIDVLFFGSMNDRRSKILSMLRERGYHVKELFGVYGKIRDSYISRSKIVLNIHYYSTNIFEAVRLSYLLNNSVFVITESSPFYPWKGVPLPSVPYNELVAACAYWLENDVEREKMREKMAQAFESLYPMTKILFESLRSTSAHGVGSLEGAAISGQSIVSRVPRVLNIGSGKDFRNDCLNADCNSYWNPDIILDLCKPVEHQLVHQTERFGMVRLQLQYFDEIIAHDVLEHLSDLPTAMTSCLALLKDGGRFRIKVPYDLSYGAWQDPTHVRGFNERSWLYYTDWFWYLGWKEARFEVEELILGPSALGRDLLAKGVTESEICRHPRAIDEMSVVLRKRSLNGDERAFLEGLAGRRQPSAAKAV